MSESSTSELCPAHLQEETTGLNRCERSEYDVKFENTGLQDSPKIKLILLIHTL